MATSTISNTILDPSGTVIPSVTVQIRLMPTGGFRSDTFTEVARLDTVTTDSSGFWSIALERNSNITPSNSWYEVTELVPDSAGGKRVYQIAVGASNQTLLASLVTPATQQPTVVPAGTTYLSQAAADARYQAVGSLGSGSPTTSAVADAAAAGVATSASRSDHKHGRESFGTPVATGDANATGSATTLARSDHVHKGVVAADAWTSYTPTLTQSGAVTKTVTYAKYIQMGKTVIVNVRLACTGAGTAGQIVAVGLPVAAASAASLLPCGTFFVRDDSTATSYHGAAVFDGSTTAVQGIASAQTNFLGVAAFTAALANLDGVGISVMYEAA